MPLLLPFPVAPVLLTSGVKTLMVVDSITSHNPHPPVDYVVIRARFIIKVMMSDSRTALLAFIMLLRLIPITHLLTRPKQPLPDKDVCYPAVRFVDIPCEQDQF